MSKLSLNLQAKSLKDMADVAPYQRKLAGIEYKVLPRVYKGSTDTELFCEILPIESGFQAWDIGTGTGLIAFAAKKKGAEYVLATDLNSDAVKNARENAKRLGLDIDIQKADLFGNIQKKFDVITFNPPFTDFQASNSYEISFWDKDNQTVKNFICNVKNYLKPNGRAFIAWSSFGKISKLKKIARSFDIKLKQIGKRKGKRNFYYYVFEILFDDKI